jgi:hypothetical protein
MAAATKKKRKEEAYPWKAGPSSVHITNFMQSILETFDIYGTNSNEHPKYIRFLWNKWMFTLAWQFVMMLLYTNVIKYYCCDLIALQHRHLRK